MQKSSNKVVEKSKNFLPYRPEIDGLRALAVIPVILYHLKIKGFAGGFIGVDVFFVISGFLITSIIFREIQNDAFSIVNFYERRIRRIFPALFLVLFFVGISGYFLLDPDTFKDLGQSILSTTFFFSNFALWNQAGYFDKPAELKPLLHTWSLAVEEQFYIFFPLLCLLVWRLFKKHFKAVLVLLATASFILSQVWLSKDASADFYLLPFRSWELLLGGILAVGSLPRNRNKIINNLLSFLGLFLILYAVIAFSAKTPFPGAAALLPTLGAVLIIYSSSEGNTIVSTGLSWKPLVFIGNISYSLYLWHWVLIVLARYYNILPLSTWQNIQIIIATFVISTLTWKFIENPFRNKKAINRKMVFSFGVTVALITGAVGYYLSLKNGLPERFEPLPKYSFRYNDSKFEDCLSRQRELMNSLDGNSSAEYLEFVNSFCNLGDINNPPSVAIFSDSHGVSLSNGLDKLFNSHGINATLIYGSNCPPSFGISLKSKEKCNIHNDLAIKYITENNEIETVLLVGFWGSYANGTKFRDESIISANLFIVDPTMAHDNLDNQLILQYGLENVITTLEANGKKVVFVNDVPEIGYPVPQNFSIAKYTHRDLNTLISPTSSEFLARYQPVFEIVDYLKTEHPSLYVINTYDSLCSDYNCIVEKDGYPLYKDDHHLNIYGSDLVADEFKSILDIIN